MRWPLLKLRIDRGIILTTYWGKYNHQYRLRYTHHRVKREQPVTWLPPLLYTKFTDPKELFGPWKMEDFDDDN